MKKTNVVATALLTMSSLLGCKKNTDAVPAFSPVGDWVGTLADGAAARFINRADGTSRFYAVQGDIDTANSPLKFYGTYKVKDNIFYGDYSDSSGTEVMHAETAETGPNYMEGGVIISFQQNQAPAEALPFEVFKRP